MILGLVGGSADERGGISEIFSDDELQNSFNDKGHSKMVLADLFPIPLVIKSRSSSCQQHERRYDHDTKRSQQKSLSIID